MVMVFIPPGEFLMGTPRGDPGWGNEETQHLVRITRPFYMGKYEVTEGEWRQVGAPGCGHLAANDRLPVSCVSWDACREFASRAGNGLRLPTEAEWEYACRAGAKGHYCFGDDEARLGDHAWFSKNSGRNRHEVGLKTPNAWGLHDMHGNVWEWCHDWSGFYAVSSQGPLVDPQGPGSGEARVIRGGGWNGGPLNCRSSRRDAALPTWAGGTYGFRVVLNLEEP
ncbi:MAG: hypothetical protein AMK75_07260 [Planctomycetes bacterium SM23_65]|nr:MAG: hypothetical protein AMK75_07260 [Planctomycetes bacterium SM23_65]